MKTTKRIIAMLLTIAMVLTMFSMLTISASAASFADTMGHWAESIISEWSDYGVIQGDNGYFRPDDAITRAEVAQVMQNIISYTETADNVYIDVDGGAWYEDAILKLAAAGTLTGNGDGTMSPENYMTREEAMTMLARAFGLTVENTNAGITQYADFESVSDYATGYVGTMTAAGYVSGYEDGTIRPQANVSRAEFVKILDNMITLYITTTGTYGPNYYGGIVMVKSAGVVLSGVVADGAVISPSVSGSVELDNCQFSGKVVNLSATANVTSNNSSTSSNDVISPNTYYGNGPYSGGYGGSGSSTSKVTVTFFYGDDFSDIQKVTVTKGAKMTASKVPDPTLLGDDNWNGSWYKTENAAEAADGAEFDPTRQTINSNLSLYAGRAILNRPTATVAPTATATVDPTMPTATVAPTATATVDPTMPTATVAPESFVATLNVVGGTGSLASDSATVSAAADTMWMFNTETSPVLAAGENDFGNGLTYIADSKSAYDTGAECDGITFANRIKLGGKSTFTSGKESRVFKFTPSEAGTLTVYFLHGSSDASERSCVVYQGGTQIAKVAAQYGDANDEGKYPAVPTMLSVDVVSGSEVLVGGDNNIGIFGLKFASGSGEAPADPTAAPSTEAPSEPTVAPATEAPTAAPISSTKWSATDYIEAYQNDAAPAVHTIGDLTMQPMGDGWGISENPKNITADHFVNGVLVGQIEDGLFDCLQSGANTVVGDDTSAAVTDGSAFKLSTTTKGTAKLQTWFHDTETAGNKFTIVKFVAGELNDGVEVFVQQGHGNYSFFDYDLAVEPGYDYYVYNNGSRLGMRAVEFVPEGAIPSATDAPTAAPATDAPTVAPATEAPTAAPATAAPATAAPATEAPATDAPTAAPSTYTFAAGSVVTFTGTPNNAGDTATMTVVGADGTSVAVDGFTFTMPAQSVTVTVTYAAVATPAPTVDPNAPLPSDKIWVVGSSAVKSALSTAGVGTEATTVDIEADGAIIGKDYKWKSAQKAKYTHTNGTEYNFVGAMQAGSGSTEKRFISIVPEKASCTVTVVFDGGESRVQYIYYNGQKIGEAACGKTTTVVTADIPLNEMVDGAPIYTYGGGSNKNVYAIFIEYYKDTPNKQLSGNVTNETGRDFTGKNIVFTNVDDPSETYTVAYGSTYDITMPKGKTFKVSIEGESDVCTTTDTKTIEITKNKYDITQDLKFVLIRDMDVSGTVSTISSHDLRTPVYAYDTAIGAKVSFTKQGDTAAYATADVNADGTYTAKLISNETYDLKLTTADGQSYTLSPLSTTYEFQAGDETPFKNILLMKDVAEKLDYKENLTVGADKDYPSISEAIAAVRLMTREAGQKVTITVDSGTYQEQLYVDVDDLVIKAADPNNKPVVQWYYGIGYVYYSPDNTGWYSADKAVAKIEKRTVSNWGATIRTWNRGFLLENMDVKNSFNLFMTQQELDDGVYPGGGDAHTQFYRDDISKAVNNTTANERAAAIYAAGSEIELYNCSFTSSQDTFGSSAASMYVKDCDIAGNTDYICGGNNCYFENCNLIWQGFTDKDNGGYITANKNSAETDNGYYFKNCTVTRNADTSMKCGSGGNWGRNWGGNLLSKTYFDGTVVDSSVKKPKGWTSMGSALTASVLCVRNTYMSSDLTTDVTVSVDNPAGTDFTYPTITDYIGTWTPVHYTAE